MQCVMIFIFVHEAAVHRQVGKLTVCATLQSASPAAPAADPPSSQVSDCPIFLPGQVQLAQATLACHIAAVHVHGEARCPASAADSCRSRVGGLVATVLQPPIFCHQWPVDQKLCLGVQSYVTLMSCTLRYSTHCASQF